MKEQDEYCQVIFTNDAWHEEIKWPEQIFARVYNCRGKIIDACKRSELLSLFNKIGSQGWKMQDIGNNDPCDEPRTTRVRFRREKK